MNFKRETGSLAVSGESLSMFVCNTNYEVDEFTCSSSICVFFRHIYIYRGERIETFLFIGQKTKKRERERERGTSPFNKNPNVHTYVCFCFVLELLRSFFSVCICAGVLILSPFTFICINLCLKLCKLGKQQNHEI